MRGDGRLANGGDFFICKSQESNHRGVRGNKMKTYEQQKEENAAEIMRQMSGEYVQFEYVTEDTRKKKRELDALWEAIQRHRERNGLV